ncbi:hypothetical protein K435DRAFT_798846 [Dendrothele bispora CBS 962.96]|uniref:Uncharacterized protein n=1 Tax=Dendrothele bispora (strain CBS 962.96) TaxID=1314807 RepID=A0A4S8LY66_DENBC|nr:hypothetical protein K435DRAFT_798846 [Dendrothele bispora CBS 962.96]
MEPSQDTEMGLALLRSPMLIHAYRKYLQMDGSGPEKDLMGQRLAILLEMHVKTEIQKRPSATLSASLLGVDLRSRVVAVTQAIISNPKLGVSLDQTAEGFADSATALLSNVKDDAFFQMLRVPSSQGESAPRSILEVPQLRLQKQLNLSRHVHEVERDRFEELKRAGVGRGVHQFPRIRVITDQIIRELRENDPEKLRGYEEFLERRKDGDVSEGMTEAERYKSSGAFYDEFTKKMSDGYKMNMNKLESMLHEILNHQFSAKGHGMGSSMGPGVEVDRKTPLPPQLREDIGEETRDVFEKTIRDWLYRVAAWQGGGLKRKSIPWSDMKSHGPGVVFANHAECLPKGELKQIDKMTIDYLRKWYTILLAIQREKRPPVVFVDSVLKESKSENVVSPAATSDSEVKRGSLSYQVSDLPASMTGQLDGLLTLDPVFLNNATAAVTPVIAEAPAKSSITQFPVMAEVPAAAGPYAAAGASATAGTSANANISATAGAFTTAGTPVVANPLSLADALSSWQPNELEYSIWDPSNWDPRYWDPRLLDKDAVVGPSLDYASSSGNGTSASAANSAQLHLDPLPMNAFSGLLPERRLV